MCACSSKCFDDKFHNFAAGAAVSMCHITSMMIIHIHSKQNPKKNEAKNKEREKKNKRKENNTTIHFEANSNQWLI